MIKARSGKKKSAKETRSSRVRREKVKKKGAVSRMPRHELKLYKALLIKEREKVGGDLSHIANTTLKKSARDASGDLSGYSYHMADMASDDYERDFSLGRATEEQGVLYVIDEALRRVADGTYGLCLNCQKMISKKRLAALPYVELCIECQKKKEG